MNDTIQIQEKIRKFVIKTSYISDNQINNNSLIFNQGIMDSMGFISLISFLEDTFSIKASDNELLDTNFESIDAITDFVKRKLNEN